jgi:hypothetical protein
MAGTEFLFLHESAMAEKFINIKRKKNQKKKDQLFCQVKDLLFAVFPKPQEAQTFLDL